MPKQMKLDKILSAAGGVAQPVRPQLDFQPSDMELTDLWQPDEQPREEIPAPLEEQLRQRGYVNIQQIEQARSIHAKTPRKRIGQILLEMGAVKEADLLACLAEQYQLL